MAIFQMQIKTVARGAGRNAPASAAYRAGERIRNERTGVVYDHRRRRDVLHKDIFLPAGLGQVAEQMQWARDRAALWNAAEEAEHQRNSRVAREYMVALPAELAPEQRIALARTFSQAIADRYGVAVDLAVHEPRPYGDPRNFHAHLLATTREITPDGLGAKTGLDMTGTVRAELGMPPNRKEFTALRASWADLANEALRDAQLATRVDHRSLAEQGIDREPRPNLPVAAVAALRRGERSEAAERLLERYLGKVAARGAANSVSARLVADPSQGTPNAHSSTAGKYTAVPSSATRRADLGERDAETRRRQAVRDWLAYREASGRPMKKSSDARQRARPGIEEIRRHAIAAWLSLRTQNQDARSHGGESQGSRGRSTDSDHDLPDRPSRDHGNDLSQ